MNKIILVGRLAQDPEVRYTPNGKAVASFNLAVNRFFGSEKADFIPIIAWEKLGEACGNNLNKGRRVLVEGRLQIRSYETTDGQKRRVAEVIAQYIEYLDAPKKDQPHDGVSQFGNDIFPEEEIPF